EIARLFNVPSLAASVGALSACKTRAFDVGCLNKRHYFLTAAVFPKKSAFQFKSYTVSSRHPDHHVSVCNADIYRTHGSAALIAPDDGVLDAIIAHHPGRGFMDRFKPEGPAGEYVPESFFPIKKITVKCASKTVSVFADAEKQLTSPIEVEVAKGALTAIVG
ncbi:MAG: hypothetical protein U1C18_00740, partial [Patescibacteria group bacterium]|nr:hypothetical protein [Patescibacteria group bacterium]